VTPEEVAAVAAVTVALEARAAAGAGGEASTLGRPQLSAWVDASRRSAQNANLQRGPWRLSGRIGRRSRT
jgi:hypothetical protein